ncbi:glycosyltransferase family 2 protein [Mediterraneibacter sp.]
MISVIVPIYNTEQYLKKCLESIRTQTYYDIEVIMIDDGSTDNSRTIANQYVIRDKRFRLFSQNNSGVSKARNKGLELAEGEYILFVDSDDWLEPKMLDILIHNMYKYGVDISCCQYDHTIGFEGKTAEIWNKEVAVKNFLIHKLINGSLVNKLIKRECIGEKRLDESIKYGEDALFLWKNLLEINSIAVSPDVLYHVTLHDDSASGGGSYKVIRKDCISVWKIISADAEKYSPESGAIARAQLANMAFFSLYEMCYYGYKDEKDQNYYLITLKNTITDLKNASYVSLGEKYLAHIFLKNMSLGRILVYLRKELKI